MRKEIPNPETTVVESPALDLHNIGFAVAKLVQFKWSFDANKAIRMVREENENGFFHIHERGTIVKLSTRKYSFEQIYDVYTLNKKQKIDFILPASIDKEPIKVEIPRLFLDLYLLPILLK